MTTSRHRVLAQAAAERAASIAFLQDLIRAGRDGEPAVQARVAEAARAAGCVVETVVYRPGDVPMVEEFAGTAAIDDGERACVLARLPGRGGGRSLIFFAHPDGEPVAGTERWTRDPFAGEIVDGRLYGWGVADDLAGVAIMVEALRTVVAAGLRLDGDVILASTPSKRHARGVSALLHGGVSADAAVYLHPAESGAGMGEVKAFASGQVEWRVVVTGRQPPTTEPLQTAFAHLAVNPIDKALVLVRALQAFGEERAARVRNEALHRAVGRSTNLMVSHIRAGDPARLARTPESCEFGCALAFPPPERLSDVKAAIEAALAEACAADEWLAANPPRVIWDSGVTGAEIPPGHPLYEATAAAIQAVTGRAPFVNPMHTSSDIRNPMVQKGIPTVGLGPLCGDLTQNGDRDEWVDADDYARAVAVVADLIVSWCGVSPA